MADLARLAKCCWKPVIQAEGAKGPILAKVTRIRVYPSRNGLPKNVSVWLLIRSTPDGQMKFSFSNAPIDMPLSQMCKASMMRRPIEQCLEKRKGQLGMDHYEHRSWPAWHRHMIYVFLGLHFMLRLRIHYKETPSLTLPQAQRLAAAALPLRSLTGKGAIEIVKYHTLRNYVAYISQREKRLLR